MYTLEALIRNVQNDIDDCNYRISECEKHIDELLEQIDDNKKARKYSENLLNKLKELLAND